MNKPSAFIIIDLQNDFCAGGVMGAQHDSQFIERINQLQTCFQHVIASQDWHPVNHVSFAANHPGCQVGDVITIHGYQQILWPNHCVQDSAGAKLHPALATARIEKIVFKGIDPAIDSYSAFYDNEHKRSTGLTEYLREKKIEHVYLSGLLTDYCVKYSALDAVQDGFQVTVIQDACFAINAHPGDEAKAIAEMKAQGVMFTVSANVLSSTE